MLWELYQQRTIADASATASRAESKSQNLGYRISELEDRIDSLAITCQALWELLREHASITDEQLANKVSEVDLRDGQADGKMRGGTENCGKCGRTVSMRHMRCLYCGEQLGPQHAFE